MANVPVLILPGIDDSGPSHWQSAWQSRCPEARRVVQDDWQRPRCADWVARLDAAVTATPGAILVAHSAGCALAAHWAAARPGRDVYGALLVAPSDPDAATFPIGATGFAPMPLLRLRFPTIVVASTDDAYVEVARAEQFAKAWGSRLVTIPNGGHLNSASNLGSWPVGLALLDELRGGGAARPRD